MSATELAGSRFGRGGRLAQRSAALLHRPVAVASGCVIVLFIVVAALAPVIAPYSPSATDYTAVLAPPSAHHLLGTDDLGRDVLSRLIYGARASQEAGVLATAIAMAVAVPVGLLAGFLRGWIDTVIARLVDVMLAFPSLIIAVGLSAIFGPSLTNATFALGIAATPGLVRVARGETLVLREQGYVKAAVVSAAPTRTILWRHILPNMASTLIVQATITIPTAIIGESMLSFLGLGVQAPTPSWGSMLSEAEPYISSAPRLILLPIAAIFAITLSYNLLGDALRDALDPRLRR